MKPYSLKLDPVLHKKYRLLVARGKLNARALSSILRLCFENVVREASGNSTPATWKALQEIADKLDKEAQPEPEHVQDSSSSEDRGYTQNNENNS